jgi:hypothetical protein
VRGVIPGAGVQQVLACAVLRSFYTGVAVRHSVSVKAGAVLAVLAAIAVEGAGARAPTPGEHRALTRSVRQHAEGPVLLASAEVSSRNPVFAAVRWTRVGAPGVAWAEVYRRTTRGWRYVWGRQTVEPPLGVCAYVPFPVVRELYGVRCPPSRALHARRPKLLEERLLHDAFESSPLTRAYAYRARLGSLCISRLDSQWAAGLATLRETVGVVWFRRSGRWSVAHETLDERGLRTRPPAPIVLSLAACVGYNAAQYGG